MAFKCIYVYRTTALIFAGVPGWPLARVSLPSVLVWGGSPLAEVVLAHQLLFKNLTTLTLQMRKKQ